MKKFALVALLVFALISTASDTFAVGGDDWWSECAASSWDGTCGSVERCCQSKYNTCWEGCNDTWGQEGPGGGHTACWDYCRHNYWNTCVPGALTCVDDPNG